MGGPLRRPRWTPLSCRDTSPVRRCTRSRARLFHHNFVALCMQECAGSDAKTEGYTTFYAQFGMRFSLGVLFASPTRIRLKGYGPHAAGRYRLIVFTRAHGP